MECRQWEGYGASLRVQDTSLRVQDTSLSNPRKHQKGMEYGLGQTCHTHGVWTWSDLPYAWSMDLVRPAIRMEYGLGQTCHMHGVWTWSDLPSLLIILFHPPPTSMDQYPDITRHQKRCRLVKILTMKPEQM